uniref:Uncharacterized protein n=1 Tax=Ixodes ricinus TaxID=34613 RepID=A0A6B0V4E5_IXORI
MKKVSEIAPQRRRRAEKLNSNLEVVAPQLAVERRKTEQKKAKHAAETPEQSEERLTKRRHKEADRRARPSQQQQQQDAVDDVKARRLTDYTVKLGESASATRTFETDFVNNPFGYVCDLCERLWHMKDLTPVSSAMRETLSLAAPPEWGETVARVCTTCKNFLVKQKIPLFSEWVSLPTHATRSSGSKRCGRTCQCSNCTDDPMENHH